MKARLLALSLLSLLLLAAKPTTETAAVDEDEPLRIATAYLNAIEGSGHDYGRSYLLGKVTLDAAVVKIANWKIVQRHPEVTEKAALAKAIAAMRGLDKAGSAYLKKKYQLKTAAEISREQAKEVLAPTKAQAEGFLKAYPLFAKMARADTWVYWNPDNPWRQLLGELGQAGDYTLQFHQFDVEEVGPRSSLRVWPLRVLRIQTKVYDSGWKVLPASSWDPSI